MRGQRMIRRARDLAESLMQSTVQIRRKTGTTRDEDTGQLVPTWVVVYEGPGRVRFGNSQPRDLDASGQRVVEQSPVVSLPISTSAGVHVDDEGEVLSNPADPGIVGLRFRIAGLHAQTHASARRFPVEVFTYGG